MTKGPVEPCANLRVGVLQFSAGSSVDVNLERLEDWLSRAPDADLLALPEMVTIRSCDDDLRAAAESLKGPCLSWFSERARRMGTWILIGSLPERDGESIYCTSVLLDRDGAIAAAYRKIHLFEARKSDGSVMREHDVYEPGCSPVMTKISGWPAGMSICFDLRFPELYRRYADLGADLLTMPSSFTQSTGRDHWEILVRARAIENQCFAIAPNQCGLNRATGTASYGHSLVVDPWGTVLASGNDHAEQWLTAMLERNALETARRRIPALAHRCLCASR